MTGDDGRSARCLTGVLLAACLVAARPAAAADAPRGTHVVDLTLYVKLDRVSDPGGTPHGKVGDVDRIRLTYDAQAVDPVTRRVPLLGFQHLTSGKDPAAGNTRAPPPGTGAVPVADSWLDLSHLPYRLHFKASVVHGESIVIDADESTRRLTIHRPGDANAVVIAGPYWIDPLPERAAPRRSR